MSAAELQGAVSRALAQAGYAGNSEVVRLCPAAGGAINTAHTAWMADGAQLFVKSHAAEPGLSREETLAMFEAERTGLELLRASGCIRVPEPLAVGELAGGAFLVMEHIALQPLRDQRRLGEQLAAMHLAPGPAHFGLDADNWVGSTPQPNGWYVDWVDLLRDRMRFQLDRAQLAGAAAEKGWELLRRLPGFFAGVDVRPSLVHGDLHAHNFAADEHGAPVIYDPAVYWGHHESELGIMRLFGGYTAAFADAYHWRIPRAPGFERRAAVYKLYHALNHYNLFGAAYLGLCEELLEELVG
ncbi:hypothetical protein H4R18_002828 [Coemansia javaensis]|uniref:protein-ribulosamine 3-kinase n=1 Tax=Coemansia javaensis TaxID=2761396 RepID=A0A9W8HAX8_9FUNG|nr:hypothetical protein H4R18_002828 [Coemansia javaensis]